MIASPNDLIKPHKKVRKYIAYPEDFVREIDRIHFVVKHAPLNQQMPWDLIPKPFSAGDEIALRYFAFEELVILVRSLIQQFVPPDKKDFYINQLPFSAIQFFEALLPRDILAELTEKYGPLPS